MRTALLFIAVFALGSLGGCQSLPFPVEFPDLPFPLPDETPGGGGGGGGGGSGGEGPTRTPGGGVVFERPGRFHRPAPGNPTRIFNISVPANTRFSAVTVDLDVEHGGWSREPSKNHSLFWLQRGKCCWPRWAGNVYGFANAFGPGRNEVRLLANAGMRRHGKKVAKRRGVRLQRGKTYHVSFAYGRSGRTMTLDVSHEGRRIARASGQAPTDGVRTDASGSFMIYFGHEDATGVGPERPSHGWVYSNLRVEFVP